MHSDKKLDTHCQKIRHLRFYVIFYLIENELNKNFGTVFECSFADKRKQYE